LKNRELLGRVLELGLVAREELGIEGFKLLKSLFTSWASIMVSNFDLISLSEVVFDQFKLICVGHLVDLCLKISIQRLQMLVFMLN
jgi:hypothetical protein